MFHICQILSDFYTVKVLRYTELVVNLKMVYNGMCAGFALYYWNAHHAL